MNLRFVPFGVLLAATAWGAAAPAEETTTVVTSDGEGQMVSTDKETTITFHDNVVVTGTDLRLTCDFLQVIVLRTGDPSAAIGKLDKFKSLLATGNVHLVQGARDAACGRAEVLPGEDRIIMTEHPVIVDRDQGTRISGRKITILRGQRRVFVEEPDLVGPPIKDLGPAKDKPAGHPAPATPPKSGS
ncbi:MAG TPA: LptA/OstA family protein [Candidatus Didemnitutus sp.]|jgi:lipopolysaccharide export system protein LptA